MTYEFSRVMTHEFSRVMTHEIHEFSRHDFGDRAGTRVRDGWRVFCVFLEDVRSYVRKEIQTFDSRQLFVDGPSHRLETVE